MSEGFIESGGSISQIGCRVYNSVSISIPDNTATALTFDSDLQDFGEMHSTTTNTNRIIIPVSGFYLIVGNIRWASSGLGSRQVRIDATGSITGTIASNRIGTSVLGNTDMIITTTIYLTVGDYLELIVVQTSGGNLNITAVNSLSPHFMCMLIGF